MITPKGTGWLRLTKGLPYPAILRLCKTDFSENWRHHVQLLNVETFCVDFGILGFQKALWRNLNATTTNLVVFWKTGFPNAITTGLYKN
jgi:hypothetical protein